MFGIGALCAERVHSKPVVASLSWYSKLLVGTIFVGYDGRAEQQHKKVELAFVLST